jgi:hypothetical protein
VPPATRRLAIIFAACGNVDVNIGELGEMGGLFRGWKLCENESTSENWINSYHLFKEYAISLL